LAPAQRQPGVGSRSHEHPQAVMYEPTADGKMMLIALEYITPKGPASLVPGQQMPQ
jgi:hypothetical protein